MKISIITVSFNAEKSIEKTIQSVLSQDYADVEYLIIDGFSKDGTMEIVNRYSDKIAVIKSENDKGMYDAINKGIALATGEIIGILNADDVFASDDILSQVATAFETNNEIDATIGDIAFVNDAGTTTRYYSAKKWHPGKFVWGFMPPHPSFYCRRECFEKWGFYRTDFEIAADYELLIRFFEIHQIQFSYLPLRMVNMSLGGKSTRNLRSTLVINQEIQRACILNGLTTNPLMLYSKYIFKVLELFRI